MPLGFSLSRTDWIIPSIGAAGFWVSFVVSLTIAAILLLWRMYKIQQQPAPILLAKLDKLK